MTCRGARVAPAPALVAALAALVTLGGCGGSSLSARDLRADATRACTVGQARTNRITAPASPAAGATFLRRGLAVLTPELDALRSLHPRGGLASNYNAAVDVFGGEVNAIRATLTRLGHGSDPLLGFPALARLLAPLETRENAAWQSLDIPACVQR
jgi:hypothetical protein